MSRRRLRVICSSDEEDEEPRPPPPPPQQQKQYEEIDEVIIDDIETDFQTVTLNSSNPTPSSNYSTTNRNGIRINEPIPLDISDDDVEENVVISEPSNASSFDYASGNNGYFGVSESPVNGVLESLGVRMKTEWLDSCLDGLQSSVMGFPRLDDSAKAKLCFEQLLRSDMNYCGAGVLPPDVHTLHLVDLEGPFVLQVDEIVNISCPLRRRYQSAGPGSSRCLKLSMTDGVQRVYGMEYRPIRDLQDAGPAGFKVAVCNVNVRHGLLMLVPEVVQVLGGSVEELEAARQRLVDEINKPTRGRRNKTGVVPPLATRATRAAWPPHNDAVRGHVDTNTSVPQQASTQGTSHRQATAFPEGRNNAQPNSSSAQENNGVPRHTHIPAASIPSRVCEQGTAFGINNRPRECFRVPTVNAQPSSSPAVQPVDRVTISHDIDEASTHVTTPSTEARQVSRHNVEPDGSSALPMDVEEISVLDELERQFMLTRDKDFPFTYLASLSATCAAMEDEAPVVRGKIKCFLTSVKGFRHKHTDKYELRVFVDDGSLISEILIDHSVVQNVIGYSPDEVTVALDSSDSAVGSAMRDTLKQFQKFLVNFEGTMVVEMSKTSLVPVAVEMKQGCSASDAFLLLQRLQSFCTRNTSRLNPINLSP